MKTEARYEMTPDNLAEAIAMARASTRGCRWGSIMRTEAEFQKCLDAGIGDEVWCTWIPDPDPKSEETLFVGVTGNGPTSEANARFLAHARDIVIALGEEVRRLRRLEALAIKLSAFGHFEEDHGEAPDDPRDLEAKKAEMRMVLSESEVKP